MIRLTLRCAIATTAILVVRRWQLHWGATHREFLQEQPGDELLVWADLTSTRAVSINAPAELVWPWIVQIGQDRGGFYSFDWLENAFGCNIHSARKIESRWQHIEVGMQVHLHPSVSLDVGLVDPGVALVLHGGVSPSGGSPRAAVFDSTWAFIIQERPDGNCRLISRERYSCRRPWARLIIEPMSLVSFVMSRKMLHGIKIRAEASLPK